MPDLAKSHWRKIAKITPLIVRHLVLLHGSACDMALTESPNIMQNLMEQILSSHT